VVVLMVLVVLVVLQRRVQGVSSYLAVGHMIRKTCVLRTNEFVY